MNIYLIGMPASGKSSVGKCLKDIIKYEYIDLDQYIEKKNNMSIPEIFEKYKEIGFRERERDALNDFKNKDSYIISCGGGIVFNKSNKELMNGKVIFIDSTIEDIKKRLELDTINIRPMFKVKTVEELYNERIDKYLSFMDIKVLNKDVKICANEIKKELKL